ncbi:MAG: TonB-dependent receptor [Bacteroidetes bacterium]|nr:TonB-dependent receptor [Bacteroidota bacterium]
MAVFPVFALYTIKGKIVDSSNQTPIDFVNVALYKTNSETPTAGVTSDNNGNFQLPQIPNGNYTLKVSFVGYNTLNLPLHVDGKEMNIGIIKLVEDSKTLNEVQVLGQGTQMKFDIDKKVFSVDQNLASAGGSATEVLQNIPSVDVDNEGNISLRNNSSVEVWINGKPSGLTAENRAQILQQMPAESIESIEVMTNPSAKFNPEGTAGIINIVLKKNRKAGYYGSLSAGLSYSDGTKKPGGTLGANVNYSSGKVDAFLNIGYRAMSFGGGSKTKRYSLAGTDTLSLLNQDADRIREHAGIFVRAGADFHLNDKNTLSLSGFTLQGSGDNSSVVKNTLTNFETLQNTRKFKRDVSEDGSRKSYNLTLDYKIDFDKKGSNLLSSLSFSQNSMGGNQTYKQTNMPGSEFINGGTVTQDVTQTGDNKNKEFIFKTDYTKKFSEKSKLEAGWQSTVQLRENPADGYDNINKKEIESYFNIFNYNEQNHAAYVTYGTSFMKKLVIQAGVRGEYLIRHSDYSYKDIDDNWTKKNVDVDYKSQFRLFPSAFVSYSLPGNNELQINYTSRINRPRGRQIDPFRDYSDSTNISYGNVNLLPEYSSALEFNYLKSWDEHSLSASAYYRYTDQVIQRVSFVNNGTLESTFMNLTQNSNTGIELVAKNRLFKILNLTSSLNFYYEKLDSSEYVNPYNTAIRTSIEAQDNFSWGGRVMANVILGRTTFGQITADYSAPRVIAQGKETASYSIDLGLRQTLFNRQLSLNFTVRDLLNSRKRNTTTWGDGFYQTNTSYFNGRMFGITATYNFGNMKPKQSERKRGEQPQENIMMEE